MSYSKIENGGRDSILEFDRKFRVDECIDYVMKMFHSILLFIERVFITLLSVISVYVCKYTLGKVGALKLFLCANARVYSRRRISTMNSTPFRDKS